MKQAIRLRISRQRIEALVEISEEMLEEFRPVTAHHLLLREYLSELRHALEGMLVRNQDKYTLGLSSAQALAFYQLWHLLDIRHDKYATIIVDGLMRKMGQLAA